MRVLLAAIFMTISALGQVVNVLDFGAVCDGSNDDTTHIQAAFNSSTAKIIIFPESPGLCRITSELTLINKQDKTLISYGSSGGLKVDGLAAGSHVINISGSNNITIQGLNFVGVSMTTSVDLAGIWSSGTTANPAYGNIRIVGTKWTGFPGMCLAVGANTGQTAYDVSLIRNTLIDCGYIASATNTIIDTGSDGTKLRYLIDGNTIRNTGGPTSGARAPAIFAGHGTNYDFRIVNNEIEGVPGDGISTFDRPYGSEATSYKNSVIAGNTIRNPGGACISVWGGDSQAVTGNSCLNPGRVPGAGFGSVGIGLGFGVSGTASKPVRNVSITGNVLVDDQSTHTMSYGIIDAGANVGYESQGTIAGNRISGQTTAAYSFLLNSRFIFADPSDYFVTRQDSRGSDTSQGYYLARQWRPRQNTGDEANSGVLDYGILNTDSLSIVGKGSSVGDRNIILFDKVRVGSSSAAPVSLVLSDVASLTFGTIAAQTCNEQEIAIAGVSGTDSVYANPVNGHPTLGITWSAIPGGNKIIVRVCNPTSAGIAVTTQQWRGVSIRF